jgi:hypothetical protein
MTQQPEALRLADALTAPLAHRTAVHMDAAAELRRLHEESIEDARIIGMSAERELRLRTINAQLVAALNAMLTHMGMDEDEWNKPTFDQARAAIAAAKEQA